MLKQPTERQIQPCNFRSAGRLSNESARALTTLHEVLARNLVNSLDVYLGTGLEVKMGALDHLSVDDYRAACLNSAFILPCAVRPSAGTVLLEVSNILMFTMIDLLLGGSGTNPADTRELTEIDEEIMQGVGALIAHQVERVWSPVGISLVPGTCLKPAQAHRVFPLNEKVLRIRLDVLVADMVGAVYLAFPASIGSNLVRNIKAESSISKSNVSYFTMPSLEERMLDCAFALTGELPQLNVLVRDLAALEVGSLLKFSASVATYGRLTLEDQPFYNVSLVQQGHNKALQLLDALSPHRLTTGS
jgi:flagellar motor switch protein FliM